MDKFVFFVLVEKGENRDCCMIFVDEMSRVYQNWKDFQSNNEYGEGIIVAPKLGIYSTDDNEKVTTLIVLKLQNFN